jgi:Peptidase family C25
MPSIKLSVTIRAALVRKYGATALGKIDSAIAAWIAADQSRGFTNRYVALDDAAAMTALGASAIKGKVTAFKVKRAIDVLVRKLAPDYLVLLGGDDVLPHFVVPNPSFSSDPNGDDDPTVLTDNPYASSRAYKGGTLKSYLVPDRVVGRIPDLPAIDGQGDPAAMLAALKTATRWKPKAKTFYGSAYATCCDTWKNAGEATMRYLELPVPDLLISPPAVEGATTARSRLARKVHMTKCHGVEIDAHFYGQKGSSYPEILFSGTLKGRVRAGTLAAAMCCYGARVYSPADRAANPSGALPVPIAYLQAGAVGFLGATKIAWVGSEIMMCADWIVGSYLKKALAGASLGRAALEAKQDYLQYLLNQGINQDTADEKTMIEFVLLGDPSIHPVKSTAAPAALKQPAVAARNAALRTERRVARAVVAAQVQKAMPTRTAADAPSAAHARKVFRSAAGQLDKSQMRMMEPGRATVSRLLPSRYKTAMPRSAGLASAAARSRELGEVVEYTWSARKEVDGLAQILMLKVQADAEGNVLRSRLLHSS